MSAVFCAIVSNTSISGNHLGPFVLKDDTCFPINSAKSALRRSNYREVYPSFSPPDPADPSPEAHAQRPQWPGADTFACCGSGSESIGSAVSEVPVPQGRHRRAGRWGINTVTW